MSNKNPSRDASLEPSDARPFSNGHADNGERGVPLRGRKAANPGTTSWKTAELVKRFKALQKEFLARQRKRAHVLLAVNKAAFEVYLPQCTKAAADRAASSLPIPRFGDVLTDLPGSPRGQAATVAVGSGRGGIPALPPGVLPLPLSDRRVAVKQVGGSQQLMRAVVRIIPAVQQPPSYTTWSYLKRNELARDHGRRMFLVDEVGETVPADDGETEERLPWEDVDGAAVDWAMAKLADECGWDDPDMLEALVDALRPQPQPEAISQRLAYLRQGRLPEGDRQDVEVEEVIDMYSGSFCRRCRDYGCRTHSGGHVKPHHRPAPPPPDMSSEPCGPDCWKRKLSTAAGAGLGDAAAGGPRTVVSDQGPDGSGRAAPARPPEGDTMEVDGCGAAGTRSGRQQQQPQRPAGTASDPGVEGAAAAAAPPEAGAGDPRDGGGGGAGDGSGRSAWSVNEMSTLRHGLRVCGAGNPCMLALLLCGSRTCAEVKEAVERIDREQRAAARGAEAAAATASEATAAAAAGPSGAAGLAGAGTGAGDGGGGGGAGSGALDGSMLQGLGRVPARRKGTRTKKAVLTSKSTRSLVVSARAQHGSNDWHEYQPCTCVGKCKADCPCVRAHNFCEKFCACSTTCRERFRGCTCKSGCKNNQCPCWAAGRECDPDLCGGCAPTLESRAELGRECHNMRLRMRQHAHVVLGTSDIPGAGWGLFAAQYVAKNGFLGEYTGDLITQDEANRRGSVYDHMNNSYLFNLNNEWVVDAKFRGNKLRCANHSREPVAKAKVLLVDGESRIAILADKNISPGMEITYNYRYSDDTAPQWV